MNSTFQQKQKARQEAQQKKREEQLQEKLSAHVHSFPIKLLYPTRLFSSSPPHDTDSSTATNNSNNNKDQRQFQSSPSPQPPLRTDPEFIQFYLLESGLDFATAENANDPDRTAESHEFLQVQERLQNVVNELEETGCYDNVRVMLGRQVASADKDNNDDDEKKKKEEGKDARPTPSASLAPLRQVDVILKEKNWYKLYIGGGIKGDASNITGGNNSGSSGMGPGGLFPKIQFETSASLLNLTGHCDKSHISYTVDQTSMPTFTASHTRPLYTCFNSETNLLWDTILAMDQGCKMGLSIRGQIDTIDHEYARSSRDHIQLLGMRIANTMNGAASGSGVGPTERPYTGLDWTLSHRDILPRRHASIPYLCDTSPEILAASGPSLKHSIVGEYKLNGYYTDNRFNPTMGVDSYGGLEVAGPPGNVGFMKLWGGGSIHLPFFPSLEDEEDGTNQRQPGLSFHSSFHAGVIKPLSFGGLLSNNNNVTNLADRFYVGGPNQLRGFLPAGIGPRAETGGASTPGGDSVGGDAFYTATTALSIPFPGMATTGARLFGFANAGTLTGLPNLANAQSFIMSSRVAVGGGLSVGTPMGRIEATYSFPMRYGPRDARKAYQLGIGMNFG